MVDASPACGADVNIQDKDGQTVLEFARNNGRGEIAEALRAKGAHAVSANQDPIASGPPERSAAQDLEDQLDDWVDELVALYRKSDRGEGFVAGSRDAQPIRAIGERINSAVEWS